MSRNALVAALVLPLVVIALGVVRSERHLANSTRFTFEVQGYDPRDLLRGHYIEYRIALHEAAPVEACRDDDPECCLCLSAQSSRAPPRVQRAGCTFAQSRCDGALRTRYLPELRRYYIPEHDAPKLDRLFRNAATRGGARLVVAIDDQGKPQVEALLVDGRRIDQRER